jgi:FkbM family methyltransferase
MIRINARIFDLYKYSAKFQLKYRKPIVLFFYYFGFYGVFSPKKKREIRAFVLKWKTDKATKREKNRIQQIPRYTTGIFQNGYVPIKFIDSASFLVMYNEILERQIYRFNISSETPVIIDAGANIGLSIIYFKQLYPNASVLGFEPDPIAFETLKYNIQQLGLTGVEVLEKGVWNKETSIRFYAEGADAGRIALDSDQGNITHINTIRLKDYLNRHIDFLKIDIEGAETTVLKDCGELLRNVDRIFVEYHSFDDQGQELHDLLNVLFEMGFRYRIEQIGISSPNPFTEINTYLKIDNQLNIFAYR